MPESIAFDRAAAFYDRTRALETATARAQTQQLGAELAGAGVVLEVGVGTGRVGLPLAEAGIDVVGIDLSRAMLEVLAAKRAPGQLPAAVGDGTRLPFPAACVGGALSCHVLHLIPNWRDAVDEMVRVVRPGGVLLIDLGGHQGFDDVVHRRFKQAAGVTRARVGIETGEEGQLDAFLLDRGAAGRALPVLTEERAVVVGALIDRIANNEYSWTWALDEPTRVRAGEETRAWARSEFGSLEHRVTVQAEIRWRAFDLP